MWLTVASTIRRRKLVGNKVALQRSQYHAVGYKMPSVTSTPDVLLYTSIDCNLFALPYQFPLYSNATWVLDAK